MNACVCVLYHGAVVTRLLRRGCGCPAVRFTLFCWRAVKFSVRLCETLMISRLKRLEPEHFSSVEATTATSSNCVFVCVCV